MHHIQFSPQNVYIVVFQSNCNDLIYEITVNFDIKKTVRWLNRLLTVINRYFSPAKCEICFLKKVPFTIWQEKQKPLQRKVL